MRTGQTRIVRNIGDDPAYAPWRRNMTGYGCCIAIPLHIGGAVAGALAIYSANTDEVHPPDQTKHAVLWRAARRIVSHLRRRSVRINAASTIKLAASGFASRRAAADIARRVARSPARVRMRSASLSPLKSF